jgi:hypothetical protein
MIRVVRLAGESYDLETGDQLPKALILSNGVREFSLHVDDETARAVVEMMAEGQGVRNQSVVEKARTVKVPGNGAPPAEPQVPRQTFSPEAGVETPVPQPAMASVVDTPEDDDFEVEGHEPGEEYNDPATGVSSL